MIVLDTSALIFWTLDRERLSQIAAQAISDTAHIAISSISIWEIGIKVKKQKLIIPVSIQEFMDKLKAIDRFDILPVDAQTWIKNLELNWDHGDLLIAQLLRLPVCALAHLLPQILLSAHFIHRQSGKLNLP